MKKHLTIVLFLICFLNNVQSQESINLTQYVTGISVINPAYSGVNGRFTAQLISHNQWVGVEGAPKTNALFVNTPVTDYKIGLGATILHEKIGPNSTFTFNINTAYHTKLTDDIDISYGLKTIIGNYSSNYIGDELVDVGDPYFENTPKGSYYLNFGAGVYISGKNFALSYSATPLLRNKLKAGTEAHIEYYEINNVMNHYLMGMYAFDVNEKLVLKPSVLLRSNNNLKATCDASITGIYDKKFWAGLTYRSSKEMSIFVQLQANDKLRIGYAFDYGVSREYSLNSGSHEIICTMDIQLKKKSFVTPRYL